MEKPPETKRKPGRQPLSETGEIMRKRNVRMTDEEWAHCLNLGGAPWVRAAVKRAVARQGTK